MYQDADICEDPDGQDHHARGGEQRYHRQCEDQNPGQGRSVSDAFLSLSLSLSVLLIPPGHFSFFHTRMHAQLWTTRASVYFNGAYLLYRQFLGFWHLV